MDVMYFAKINIGAFAHLNIEILKLVAMIV
jgi:hypothetical protein